MRVSNRRTSSMPSRLWVSVESLSSRSRWQRIILAAWSLGRRPSIGAIRTAIQSVTSAPSAMSVSAASPSAIACSSTASSTMKNNSALDEAW